MLQSTRGQHTVPALPIIRDTYIPHACRGVLHYLTGVGWWWDNHIVARLTSSQVNELVHLYQNAGWRVMHLSRYYDMPHASIQHHLAGVTRNVPPINHCPLEVIEASTHVSGWRMNRGRLDKTYEEYCDDERARKEKKRSACAHTRIAVICLSCGEHLEETKMHGAKVKVDFI